jgi:putative endonuclease
LKTCGIKEDSMPKKPEQSAKQDASWRQRKGYHYENAALDYLKQHGLRLLTRNYRCKLGEIDLVMLDRAMVVFVEVRFRASVRHGKPHETVDARKQARVRKAAQYFLLCHPHLQKCDCRFDVLASWPDMKGQLQQLWLVGAFY